MAEIPEDDPKTALASKRTNLAEFRASLALDRTTLAWIRTALTFATFGFGMIGVFSGYDAGCRQPASGAFASGGNPHGSCAGAYRANRDYDGSPLPLAVTPQIAPRWATLHHAMAFEHYYRRTIAILGLYALWSVFTRWA
jgi:hypothetical protein